MFRNVVITTALFVLVGVAAPAKTNAQDMSAALARMDQIIVEMQELRAEFAALSAQLSSSPAPAVLGATANKVLTEDLSYGATNDDIARIQRLLATDPEVYPYGVDSGFFGPKTQDAIRNFQTRFGLDPVGVIGPATTALFEVFFNAYPDENYPDGVLANKPKPAVQGASTSVTTPSTIGAASSIKAKIDRGEAEVDIVYSNGNKRHLIVTGDTESEVVSAIAARTPLSVSDINAVITFSESSSRSRSNKNDNDEGDAEDAIDDADNAISDTKHAIRSAEDDDEDVDWADETLSDAKDLLDDAENALDDEDWDKAVEKANEAEDLAKEAEGRINEKKGSSEGDNDEIDNIVAEVDDGESDITVEYGNGDDDYTFTVDEDKEDEIIDAIADELDIRSREVEKMIEFDFGRIDSIDAIIYEDDGETKVTIDFRSGVVLHLTIDSTDEDDVISEVADHLNERERDIEDIIDFDY